MRGYLEARRPSQDFSEHTALLHAVDEDELERGDTNAAVQHMDSLYAACPSQRRRPGCHGACFSACAILLLYRGLCSLTSPTEGDFSSGEPATDGIAFLDHCLVVVIFFFGICIQLVMSVPSMKAGHPARCSTILVNLFWAASTAYLLAADRRCSSYAVRAATVGVPASLLLTLVRLLRILAHSIGDPRVARSWLVQDSQQRFDSHVRLPGRMASALLTGVLLRRLMIGLVPQAQQLACIFAPEVARVAMIVHAASVNGMFEWRKVDEQGFMHMAMAGCIAFVSGVYVASEPAAGSIR